MSDQAIKYKKDNPNLNFKEMSLGQLQKLPPHNGILNFQISQTSFLILNILNDDSTAVKFFWKDSHDIESLDLWHELSKEEGTFIDVGAHTGLYSITSLRANKNNKVICFEPYFMNLSRLITNLRLNGMSQNVSTILGAASDFDGKSRFKIDTEKSYLSKGGKIDKDGTEINVYKLDTLYLKNLTKPLNAIKIDTEGEDYKVLLGAEGLIKKYNPSIIIEVREENKLEISNFLKKYNYNFFDVLNLKKQIDLENFEIKNISNIFAKI